MGASVGSLNVDLSIGTARFKKGLDEAQKGLAGFQNRASALGDKFQSIGAGLSIGLTAPIVALGVKSIGAATESAAAFGQVQAALASMGDASGRSADQLSALAGRLQDTSLFDDDDIMAKSTANLLTFGNVSGQVFDRAQQAIVDYAARTNTDLQPATIMIGKALNDPIKGLTALSKVGVLFTADQKAMIASMVESGNIAGAQGIILTELEHQYKGAGKAARDASPTAATEQAWRTFQETVGAIAVKVLPPLTTALTALLDGFNHLSPGVQTFIVATGGIAATLGPVIGTIGTLAKGPGMVVSAFTTLSGFFTTTLLPVLATVGRALVGLAVAGGPLTLILAAATAAYVVWKNWDTIGPIVGRMYEAVKGFVMDKLLPVLKWAMPPIGLIVTAFQNWGAITGFVSELYQGVKRWLGDKLTTILNGLLLPIRAVHDAFNWLTDKVVRHSYVPELVDAIGVHFGRLEGNMVAPALAAVAKVDAAFKGLPSSIDLPSVSGIPGFPDDAPVTPDLTPGAATDGALDRVRQVLSDIGATGLGAFGEIATVIADKVIPALQKTGDSVHDVQGQINKLSAGLSSIFGSKIGGILGGILKVGTSVFKAFGGLSSSGTPAATGTFGGFRAAGGSVAAGRAYIVGENGPELFMPEGMGSIVPNLGAQRAGAGVGIAANALARSGNVTIQINAKDAVLTSTVRQWVQEGMQAAAVAGAQTGSADARATMAKQARRRIA